MDNNQEKIACSVPILTLNSAVHLEECLNSINDFADVFLLDGNSTDATLTLAERYSLKVFKQIESSEQNIRIKNFSLMRKKAIALAKFDWILILDSDEFLSPELIKEIRNNLKNNTDTNLAFSFPYKFIIDGKIIDHAYKTSRYVRLFNRRSGIEWNQYKLVHEKLDIPKTVKIKEMANPFFGYFPNYVDCLKKDDRYLAMVKSKLLDKESGPVNRLEVLRALFINLFRALKILILSIFVFLRWGLKNTLPPRHAWRYVRYHLFLVYYRFLQLFI